MTCRACEVWRASSASSPQRTAATIEMLLDDCIFPSSVNAGEPFTIQIKYRLCTIETRNPDGLLDNFPGYDGIYYHYTNLFHTRMEYWVWRLLEMGLTLVENPPTLSRSEMAAGEIKVDYHGRTMITQGQIFTYTFHGTIEELLGRTFTKSETVNLAWSAYGLIYVLYEPSDWFPWNWQPAENYVDFSRVSYISHSIQVSVLPPPPDFPSPLFNPDLCSVSKEVVEPSESFNIKVRIENQNETSGPYEIGCYCEGNYIELATGNIAGYGHINKTFTVTANQLAQRSITESQYLAFTLAVSNSQGETDRWSPAAIAVIVGPTPETASISGKVSDKMTGISLAGVQVIADGHSTSTDADGYYTLGGLEPGTYMILFSLYGYWEETQSKRLNAGQNILDIAMTPTTEPPPSKSSGLLWALVGLGAVGVVLVAKGMATRGARK